MSEETIRRDKMKLRYYKEFPKNIKNLTWDIYPSKKLIVVSGFKYFNLIELKKINPDIMFSLPYEIFIAISRS